MTWLELRAALILLTMTAVILPILPNETVHPWETINPFELWMMTIREGWDIAYRRLRRLGRLRRL